MTRFVAVVSVLGAYVLCAVSGVNRWTYVWLKAFYPMYAAVMWTTLVLVFVLFANRLTALHRSVVVAGALAGYFAGIIAYNLAPILMDGSVTRIASALNVDGVVQYLEMSTFFPLILLSPIAGMGAAVAFAALSRSSTADRYLAAIVGGAVLMGGWIFFMRHGVLPPHW